ERLGLFLDEPENVEEAEAAVAKARKVEQNAVKKARELERLAAVAELHVVVTKEAKGSEPAVSTRGLPEETRREQSEAATTAAESTTAAEHSMSESLETTEKPLFGSKDKVQDDPFDNDKSTGRSEEDDLWSSTHAQEEQHSGGSPAAPEADAATATTTAPEFKENTNSDGGDDTVTKSGAPATEPEGPEEIFFEKAPGVSTEAPEADLATTKTPEPSTTREANPAESAVPVSTSEEYALEPEGPGPGISPQPNPTPKAALKEETDSKGAATDTDAITEETTTTATGTDPSDAEMPSDASLQKPEAPESTTSTQVAQKESENHQQATTRRTVPEQETTTTAEAIPSLSQTPHEDDAEAFFTSIDLIMAMRPAEQATGVGVWS
ncbi:unnamed protein product, partial [Symbiodinium sp. CCMP2456]